MFHMSNDSGLFKTKEDLERDGFELRGNRFVLGEQVYLPLYEAKMMHQFDHRFATYTEAGDTRDATVEEKQDPNYAPLPRYWVAEGEVRERLVKRSRDGGVERQRNREWLLGFRDITNATNERTAIFSMLPLAGVGHTSPLVFSASYPDLAALLSANADCFALDYIARQKLGGTHVTYGFLKQFPLLAPASYREEDIEFIRV